MLALPVDCLGDFGPRGQSVQYTQAVCRCPPAHTGRPWLSVCVRVFPCVSVSTHRTSVAVHQYTCQHAGPSTQHAGHGLSTLALLVDCLSDFGPRGLSVQYTQDVCGCPLVHTERLWVSVSTHRTSVAVRVCLCVSISIHRTSVAVHKYTYQHVSPWTQHADPSRGLFGTSVWVGQHKQDVLGCPCVSVNTHRTSVAVHHTHNVRGRPPAHTGRPWLSVCTHRTSLAVRLCPWVSASTHITSLAVRGYPLAHTGRLFVSVSTHTTSVCVSVCTCVSVSIHKTFVAVRQYTYQHAGPWTPHAGPSRGLFGTSLAVRVCPWVSASTHRTSLAVRQHTQDVRVCPSAHTGRPCVSVCVRVCSSAHTRRPWLSIRTHISTLVLGLSMLAIPVDCLGDFGPRGQSVQYTGRLWVSTSTHRMTVAVRVCPCVSMCVRQHTQDVRGCPSVHISTRCTHKMSVGVRQHTQEVRGCPSEHTGHPWLSVCVCVCPSAHTGRPWLSINTHISTLVLGLSTLTLPVDCSGDFGPRGLSVQYTQDVCGCPSAHTGRPCGSVSTNRTSLAVRVCPSTHTGCPWLSISTHISTLVLGLSTLTCLVDCSGDFGPRELSVQYTQDVRGTHRTSVAVHQYIYQHDVRGCPPAHTGRLWLSVCVRVCLSAHTRRPRLSISTHISTLFLGLSTLALLVDCLGDFGPRGLSVQYTRRPWVSASTHRTSVAVRQHTQDVLGCPVVSVGVRQHTQNIVGCPWLSVGTQDVSLCPSAHTGRPCVSVCVHVCPSAHTRRSWLSVSTHISTLVLGLSMLALPVDCLGDFGPRGLSVQYTQVVCGCTSAHTGRPWLSVCVRGCPPPHTGRPWLSVVVRQHTQDVRVCPSAHRTSVCVSVCTCVSVSTHKTFVAVHPYTYQHAGPWTQHAGHSRGLFGTSLAVRVCPWVSASTHRTSLAVHHTHNVRGCLSAHTGRPWLSVCTHRTSLAVRLCLWVSASTHITSLAVRGYPLAHTGCPFVSVSTHTTSVCVSVCTCVSVSTHKTFVAVRQYTYQHAGPWTPHAGPSRGLFGLFWPTWAVCSVHTGRLSLYVSTYRTSLAVRVCPWVSASTHRTSLAVHGCPTHKTSVAVHPYTSQHAGPWTQHAGHSRGLFGTTVAVRVFPCVFVSTHRTSVAVHQYICQHAGPSTQHAGHGLSTLALLVDCLSDFGPCGLSVQYTQDVCGCPLAHTERLWVSVSTHRTSVAVRVCLCVSISIHRTSVAVQKYTYQHVSPWTQHADPSRGLFGTSVWVGQHKQDVLGCPCVSVNTHMTSVAVHQYTYQHLGPWTQHPDPSRGLFGTSVNVRECPCLSVCVCQHTQDGRGCPSVHISALHIGRPWVTASTHWTSVAVRMCPCVSVSTHKTSKAVHHTHNVRGCPPAHTGRPWLSVCTHRTSLAVRLCPWVSASTHITSLAFRGYPLAHTGRPFVSVSTHTTSVCVSVCTCVSVSTHKTFVAVRQYTYQHAGPWTPHAGPSRGLFGTSLAVRVCPWVSASTHRTSLAVLGCPSAHTGRPCVSVRTHRTSVCVSVCTCVSVSTHKTSVAVHPYTYQHAVCSVHTGRLWVSTSTHKMTVAVRVCPCVSMCVRQHTQDVRGCPSIHISTRCTHKMSVGVHQHTQEVRGCPSAHTGHPCLSVCVCVCPSAHTGRPWLSINTHISTLVLGLSTLTLPVDCSGDFGPRGLSVQYTQEVRGCPSAHTERPCGSVRTNRTSLAVRVCPSTHTGRPWLSISTHTSTLVLGLSTLTCLVDCSGDFGPRELSVQYTQDVRGTHRTSVAVHQYTYQHVVHIGRPWVSASTHWTSVAVRVCSCVSVSTHKTSKAVHHTHDLRGCPPAHTGRPWLSVSTHRTSLAARLCPWVSASTHRTSLAVCGCPLAHTGRQFVSVSTHRTSVCVSVCTCVSVSTHKTFVAVRQYTYQHAGPWTQHAGPSRGLFGCPPAHTGRPWLSVVVRQHTQDVRVCPSAHRTSVCVSVCTCVSVSTHKTSVAVHPYTYQHAGPWTQHAGHSRGLFGTTVAVRVCPCVSVSTHRTFVAVHQYTYQHAGPSTQNAGHGLSTLALLVDCLGRLWLSVCVCVCPSAHTGRSWLSINTHISTLVLGLSTLPLPVDCSGDFGPRGLSVQYTQDVRGCPSPHTGRPCVSVSTNRTSLAVCVSVNTHRTSVAVHQYTYQHVGPWTQHPDPSRGLFGTHRTSVAVHQYTYQHVVHIGRPWVSASTHWMSVAVRVSMCVSVSTHRTSKAVHHTHDVRGCPPAHTGRSWVSVITHRTSLAVCVCLWVSASTQRTYLAVRQHTHDVYVCPSAHTGCPCVSVCVRVCPSAHTRRPWLSISTHISTLVLGLSTLALLVDCLGDFGQRGLSVQYTQDVGGCPSAHTRRLWVSVSTHRTSVGVRQHTQDVRGCPCVSVCVHQHTQASVAVHQYTYQHVGPWTQHADPSRGLFGWFWPTWAICSVHTGRLWVSVSTHRTSVCDGQHKQDVLGCPCVSVNTHRTSVAVHQYTYQHVGRPWLSVSTHKTSVAVRVCPCVSVSTHRTSVAVHQYTYQNAGPWTQHAGPSRGLFGTSMSVCQHTQNVRGCPCVSVSTHRTSVAVHHTHRTSVGVCQHTQDVRGCPCVSFSTHRTSVAVLVCPCMSVSTHKTSVAVYQYTYQHAGPWTQHAGPSRGLFGTHRTSMALHQYTYQHAGPRTQDAAPSRGLFG
ncbi:hypothetical protein YC2023_066128 [Brassica napus]